VPDTYWNAEVSVDGRCVVSMGDPCLSKAIADAISHAVYYQANYPGSEVVITGIQEACARCHNMGIVRRDRFRAMRCPDCKGKGAHGQLADIPFRMPNSANHIALRVEIPNTPRHCIESEISHA